MDTNEETLLHFGSVHKSILIHFLPKVLFLLIAGGLTYQFDLNLSIENIIKDYRTAGNYKALRTAMTDLSVLTILSFIFANTMLIIYTAFLKWISKMKLKDIVDTVRGGPIAYQK